MGVCWAGVLAYFWGLGNIMTERSSTNTMEALGFYNMRNYLYGLGQVFLI